jgi:hypothetical protein
MAHLQRKEDPSTFTRTRDILTTNITRLHTACPQAGTEARPRCTSAALAVPLFIH